MATLQRLQAQAGNRAVGRLLQEKAPATPSPEPGEAIVQRDLLGDLTGGVEAVTATAKKSALSAIADRARALSGYDLVSTVFGRDLVTGDARPSGAGSVVGAVLDLVPGGAQLRTTLEQSGVVERAARWFSAELPTVGLTWSSLGGVATRAISSLGFSDLADPVGAAGRVVGILTDPLDKLRRFAGTVGPKMLEFVVEGAMALAGPASAQVLALFQRGIDVWHKVVADPIGFTRKLIESVRGGLGQFVDHVWTHLESGMFAWLTGSLAGAVKLPEKWDLRGIVGLVLDVLGLTWDHLRGRLVTLVGEKKVRFLERTVDVVQQVATRGLAAIGDQISSLAGGLMDTVVGAIRDWIARSVVGQAITKLVSMFNPAGAVIQAVIAAYNTVQFFIERAQQLGAMATGIFDSIGEIAGGSLGAAKNAVEGVLGRGVPVVLGFLARLIGLGDVTSTIRGLLTAARSKTETALDRVAAQVAKRIPGRTRGGVETTSSTSQEDYRRRLLLATRDVEVALTASKAPGPVLDAARVKYGLKRVALVTDETTAGRRRVHVHAEVNPNFDGEAFELRAGPEAEERRLRNRFGLPPGWDHVTSPKGPKGPWMVGDSLDRPDSKGRYPSWSTIRRRLWRTKAADELATGAARAKAKVALVVLDPIGLMNADQLKEMAKTGVVPAAFREGPQKAEVEHRRIPQRIADLLERAGLDASSARRLAKVGAASNLEPAVKEWHAAVDEHARHPGVNPWDDRSGSPLSSARPDEVEALVRAVRAHPRVDLNVVDSVSGLTLGEILRRSIANWGAAVKVRL